MDHDLHALKRAYIAIAKEMLLYQFHVEKSISLLPKDWLEVQNLIEDHFREKGIKDLSEIEGGNNGSKFDKGVI